MLKIIVLVSLVWSITGCSIAPPSPPAGDIANLPRFGEDRKHLTSRIGVFLNKEDPLDGIESYRFRIARQVILVSIQYAELKDKENIVEGINLRGDDRQSLLDAPRIAVIDHYLPHRRTLRIADLPPLVARDASDPSDPAEKGQDSAFFFDLSGPKLIREPYWDIPTKRWLSGECSASPTRIYQLYREIGDEGKTTREGIYNEFLLQCYRRSIQ